jgi:hypothetical protein
MMKPIILALVLVATGFFAARLGWPWLIVVVALGWALFSSLLLKDSPNRNKIVFFSSMFAFEALLIAWGFRWSLEQIKLAQISDGSVGQAYQLAAGTSTLQDFWSIVVGLMIAAILFGLVFALFALGDLLPKGRPKGTPNSDPFLRSMRRTMGLVPARWVVKNGEITTIKAGKKAQEPLMGPGEIEVQRGHAVILEQEGLIKRILPAGVHWIQSRERMAMVVPLYGRVDKVLVRNAGTLDGLQIEELEITIFHKTLSDDATPQNGDDKFRFNEDILRDKVWSASGKTWEAGVTGVTEREARSIIADYEMEQLLTLTSDEREKFKTQIQEKINKVTQDFMGVTVTVTGVGTVSLPDLAAEKLMAHWTAEKDRAVALEQAMQQNEIMVEAATARRDAFVLLFEAMNDALEKRPDVKDLVAMSFVERMERVEGEPPSGANQDLEALSKLYVIEALKSLTGRPVSHEETADA